MCYGATAHDLLYFNCSPMGPAHEVAEGIISFSRWRTGEFVDSGAPISPSIVSWRRVKKKNVRRKKAKSSISWNRDSTPLGNYGKGTE